MARQPGRLMTGQGLDPRFRLHRFDEIDSTNTEAKRLAAEGAPEFTVVLAGAQSAGRGRRGRAWASPPGNLYSSVVLRPEATPLQGAQVSFVAALAVSDVARGLLPPMAAIACKWPNDVIVNGHKISGILLESSATAGRLDWLVLGVGINVRHHPGFAGAYPSSTLADEGAADVDVDSLAALYLDALAGWYGKWRREGFGAVRAAWLDRALGLHGPAVVRLERDAIEGRFVDLDPSGALVVQTPSGERVTVAAGDVTFGAAGESHAARH